MVASFVPSTSGIGAGIPLVCRVLTRVVEGRSWPSNGVSTGPAKQIKRATSLMIFLQWCGLGDKENSIKLLIAETQCHIGRKGQLLVECGGDRACPPLMNQTCCEQS